MLDRDDLLGRPYWILDVAAEELGLVGWVEFSAGVSLEEQLSRGLPSLWMGAVEESGWRVWELSDA